MKSPIKWTGGKRKEISHFYLYVPKNFDIYIEPFFGGGALYWHIAPKYAIINDINPHLTNFYKVLRDNYELLEKTLSSYEYSKTFFNSLVDNLNKEKFTSNVEQAAIFYYLNKTSFSGKWRVNKSGEYNNTWGNYKNPNYKVIDKKYSEILYHTLITNKDFTNILEDYKECADAFIFLDPPYLNCDSMYTINQNFEDIYEYTYNYMKDCKSKVMLIVKSDKYIKNLFNEFIIDEYSINYSHNAKSQTINKHLIITNYIENTSLSKMENIS